MHPSFPKFVAAEIIGNLLWSKHWLQKRWTGWRQKMDLSCGKTGSMFQRTRNYGRTLFVNIMTVRWQGILGDTRLRSSLPETIGGHVSKEMYANMWMDVKLANGHVVAIKNLLDL
jgi:hypothetical protein